MTSALEGGGGGSPKVDKSTDKLRDHVCDKGGEDVKKSKIFMDVIDGSPLTVSSTVRVISNQMNQILFQRDRQIKFDSIIHC